LDYKFIIYEVSDGLARVTINRPEVMNAISRDVFDEMSDAFSQAADDDEVRVIIVAGAGDNFCSGHDLGSKEVKDAEKQMPRPSDPWGMMKHSQKYMWDFAMGLRDLGKPTIAMVQGYCIMGGLKLASCCDIIIASEDAKFADRAVRWGGTNVQYTTLFWDIGQRKAKEYLWTGDFIEGKEAWRLGMVNKVVPRESLEEETVKLAKRIALNDPLALRMSKATINNAVDIMGQTAAARYSYFMDALGNALKRQGESSGEGRPHNGIESARERDKRFQENA
jgi:enoyl-CoA hydratase